MEIIHLTIGTLKLEIHPSGEAAGAAAARDVADFLQQRETRTSDMGVIFATGASQLFTLRSLTAIPDLPWNKVCGFHLDEYVGLSPDHPASFRHYLREHLTQLVPMKEFHEIDGNVADPDWMCQEYTHKLRLRNPQLCLLGVGENGHLAFNDPAEADFIDHQAMKLVNLDPVCRQQQLAEGWFKSFSEVPEQALTLTIPTLFNIPKLIVSVPGRRKAPIVRQMLEEPISTSCPATILRTHPDATIYLDRESAEELDSKLISNSSLM